MERSDRYEPHRAFSLYTSSLAPDAARRHYCEQPVDCGQADFPQVCCLQCVEARCSRPYPLTLREELIPRGIRVTALMPGAADTGIWKQFWPDAPRDKMIEPESVAQAVMYAVFLPPNANLEELLVVPMVGAL